MPTSTSHYVVLSQYCRMDSAAAAAVWRDGMLPVLASTIGEVISERLAHWCFTCTKYYEWPNRTGGVFVVDAQDGFLCDL